MAALTEGTDYTVTADHGVGGKVINIEVVATADDGDTLTVDLSEYGYSGINGVYGFIHTTTGSVVAAEAPTTSVTSSVLTLTIGGATDNKARFYQVIGRK